MDILAFVPGPMIPSNFLLQVIGTGVSGILVPKALQSDVWPGWRFGATALLNSLLTLSEMILEQTYVWVDGMCIIKSIYTFQGKKAKKCWLFLQSLAPTKIRCCPDDKVMIIMMVVMVMIMMMTSLWFEKRKTDSVLLGHYHFSQDTRYHIKVFTMKLRKKPKHSCPGLQSVVLRMEEVDQNFQVGKQLSSSGQWNSNQLVHLHHSCHSICRSTGYTAGTTFEIHKKYRVFPYSMPQ